MRGFLFTSGAACLALLLVACGENTQRMNPPPPSTPLSGMYGLPSDAIQQTSGANDTENPQPTAEENDWNAALDPFSAAKIKTFLRQYPNSSHAIMASQILKDETTIRRILASGPGSRFVLPNDDVPPFIANSVGVNTERGRTIFDGVTGQAQTVFGQTILGQINATGINRPDEVTATMNPLPPCGDLSVFVISGKAGNIQGDASDPIRLLYSKKYGFIQIGGKGKIFSIGKGNVIFQTPPG
jgi:hypothetical protein